MARKDFLDLNLWIMAEWSSRTGSSLAERV